MDRNNEHTTEVDHVAMMFPDDVDVRLCCTLWARCSLTVLHHVEGLPPGLSARGKVGGGEDEGYLEREGAGEGVG